MTPTPVRSQQRGGIPITTPKRKSTVTSTPSPVSVTSRPTEKGDVGSLSKISFTLFLGLFIPIHFP